MQSWPTNTAVWRNAGSSSTRNIASRRPSVRSIRSGSSRVIRKPKPSRGCAAAFACETDAQQALSPFCGLRPRSPRQHRLPHAALWEAGAPRPGAQPAQLVYHIAGALASRPRSVGHVDHQLFYPRNERTGRPVILPGGARRIQKASPGGTWISLPQRPAIFGLFSILKSPSESLALLMVMTVCLLVYAALEYRIRIAALRTKGRLFLPKRQTHQNPTARWVFH